MGIELPIVMAGSSAKRVIGSILFVLALVAVLTFYFVVFADAENISDVPGTDMVPELALGIAIVLGAIVLLLILLMVIRSYDRREEEAEDAEAFFVPEEEEEAQRQEAEDEFEEVFEEEPEPEPTGPRPIQLKVYDIWRVPVSPRAWGPSEPGLFTFYFPRPVDAGVYVNDYIPIDDEGTKLKLRTLLAGPADFAGEYTLPEPEPEAAPEEEEPLPEPEEPLPEPVRRPPRPEPRDKPGDDFMRELEDRYTRRREGPATVTVEAAEKVYYDFQGDIHDVIDVEGIGGGYADKLRDLGVKTTARLCYEDPRDLARRLDTATKTVESWQAMAELMKVNGIGKQYAEALVRAGVGGIDELKRRSADRIASQVNEYLDGLDTNVLGSKITARRVEGWQEAAKTMRRVRMKVPDA